MPGPLRRMTVQLVLGKTATKALCLCSSVKVATTAMTVIVSTINHISVPTWRGTDGVWSSRLLQPAEACEGAEVFGAGFGGGSGEDLAGAFDVFAGVDAGLASEDDAGADVDVVAEADLAGNDDVVVDGAGAGEADLRRDDDVLA